MPQRTNENQRLNEFAKLILTIKLYNCNWTSSNTVTNSLLFQIIDAMG